MLSKRRWGAVGAMVLACGSAWGQLAPPPTEAPPPTPEWTPPPPPPAVPQGEMRAPVSRENPGPIQRSPKFPFEPWAKDEAGKLKPLSEPSYWASFRKNVMITPAYQTRVETFLAERREMFEGLVIDNIDAVRRVLFLGLLDREVKDGKALAENMRVIRPLMGSQSIQAELQARRVLTRQQIEQTNTIYGEYRKERLREAEAGHPAPPSDAPPEAVEAHKRAVNASKQRAFTQLGIEEALWVHERLLIEAAGRLATVADKIEGLDDAKRQELKSASDRVGGLPDDAAKLAAMLAIVKEMDEAGHAGLLQSTIDTRPEGVSRPRLEDLPSPGEGAANPGAEAQPAAGASGATGAPPANPPSNPPADAPK